MIGIRFCIAAVRILTSSSRGFLPLGGIYANGRGVAKDEAEAVKWNLLAAEQGNAHGQAAIGYSYLSGYRVQVDYLEAAKWLRKAAEQWNTDAQVHLGSMYRDGRGVEKDETEAYKWFLLAEFRGGSNTQTLPTFKAPLTPQQQAEGEQRAREWRLQWEKKTQEPK